MSFYGTSFYEFKQFFKRFVFENKDGTMSVFDPQDLFDQLKQKGDHWIKFDKSTETLPDGSQDDILLISHNIPNEEEANRSGLRFSGDYDLFKHENHSKIVQLLNKYKDEKNEIPEQSLLEDYFNNLFHDCNVNTNNTINQYLDYLGIKAEKILLMETTNTTEEGLEEKITWRYPEGPYLNTNYETIDLITTNNIEILKPGTVASIPDFDLDEKGHIVLKGKNCFTFPDTVIGFIGPNGEIIKVSASDNSDGSYVFFTGNGYIDFTFDEKTGALSINHKIGTDAEVERISAMPNYFDSISKVIEYLNEQQDKEEEGSLEEPKPDITKEDVKIQSFRSGNVLQIPNFKYDIYGHMVQDDEEPYNYYSLDMADAYTIENFTTTFGEGDWKLYNGYEDLYYKEITSLTQKAYTKETIFNAACDNVTRLLLIEKGLAEFYVDNEEGHAIMYVRGDLSNFEGDTSDYAFQVQIVNSYNAASLPLGINGTVIVSISDVQVDPNDNTLAIGVCSHKYSEIKNYLDIGKTVLCWDKITHEYYVPYQDVVNEENPQESHIIFTKITNDDNDNIVSVKISVYEDKTYLKSLNFDFNQIINDFVNELKDNLISIISPKVVNNNNQLTAEEIYNYTNIGYQVFYNPEGTTEIIPLTYYSEATGAIFSYNHLNDSGILTITMYTIDNTGAVTNNSYEISASTLLPSGGTPGQMLMVNEAGIPQWTSFLSVDTNDDNLLSYYNSTTEAWEPVSAS